MSLAVCVQAETRSAPLTCTSCELFEEQTEQPTNKSKPRDSVKLGSSLYLYGAGNFFFAPDNEVPTLGRRIVAVCIKNREASGNRVSR